MYKKLGILLILVAFVFSCGTEDSQSTNANTVQVITDNYGVTQSYTYSFTYNGCATGTHTFNSINNLCAALKNHPLNNNCAANMRQTEYSNYSCVNYTGSW